MTAIKCLIAAIALNVPAIATAAATNAPVKLEIAFTGIEMQKGAIMAVLFNSEDAYNGKGAPVRAERIPADKAAVARLIEGLPAGKYAIKSFHDIDGDGKMGTNPFGMPTEPFAFSNNAKGNMGPASWTDASFAVKAGANTHTIEIK